MRERREEIPALARHLLRKFNQEYGRLVEDISQEAIALLQEYSWPGNVRELENILGRAIINMRPTETVIRPEHLPQFFPPWPAPDPGGLSLCRAGSQVLKDAVAGDFERGCTCAGLWRATQGQQDQALAPAGHFPAFAYT